MAISANFKTAVGHTPIDTIAQDIAKLLLQQQLEFAVHMLQDDPDTDGPAYIRDRLLDCREDVGDMVFDWTNELNRRINEHLKNLVIDVKTVTYDARENCFSDADVEVKSKQVNE